MNGIYCFWSQKIDPLIYIPMDHVWRKGKEGKRGKKDFCCVKQTDEQRDPQRGCVMFGQPLFCVCSVFAWNSHDHQTPGYNTPRITLNTSHILTSELRTLHFSDIGKFIQVYPWAFDRKMSQSNILSSLSVSFCWLSTGNYACHLKTRAENCPE